MPLGDVLKGRVFPLLLYSPLVLTGDLLFCADWFQLVPLYSLLSLADDGLLLFIPLPSAFVELGELEVDELVAEDPVERVC